MLKSTPFLLFDGDCAEAMTFYHESCGGELTLTRLAETPMKDAFPAEKHGRIINARLVAEGIDVTASDWMAAPDFEPVLGNMAAIYLTSDTVEELEAVFERLSRDASDEWFQPLREMPFGTYGQFFDRFGVQWIFRGPSQR